MHTKISHHNCYSLHHCNCNTCNHHCNHILEPSSYFCSNEIETSESWGESYYGKDGRILSYVVWSYVGNIHRIPGKESRLDETIKKDLNLNGLSAYLVYNKT